MHSNTSRASWADPIRPERLSDGRQSTVCGPERGMGVGGGAGLAVSLAQGAPAGTSATPNGTPAPSIEPNFPTNGETGSGDSRSRTPSPR